MAGWGEEYLTRSQAGNVIRVALDIGMPQAPVPDMTVAQGVDLNVRN
jgi:hypothetical protein